MIVKMRRQEFDSLAIEELFKACFEPLILVYKNLMVEQTTENMPVVKEQFYEQLTQGQKALFVFQMYYIHAIQSLTEFYWWNAYFMAQPKIWSAIKGGLKYFRDDAMFQLLEDTEVVLKKYNHPSSLVGFTITREDLNHNNNLLASIRSLHSMFDDTAPLTIKIISENIRKNPGEFVQFNH